jgi:actin related protein 2/3 complex subunit 2
MILLEYNNRIIVETLQSRLDAEKKEVLDVVLADFDGVKMHISNVNPDQKNLVTVSIAWRCIQTLLKNGGQEDLKAIYGNLLQSSPEKGYDVSLQFDIDNIPGDKQKFIETVSLLKRHLLAAPFKKAFQATLAGTPAAGVVSVDYRDDESIYIKGGPDAVTVIFSINFKDPNDQVLARVFLQEFSDARRNLNSAPAVTFRTREPPDELKGVPGVKAEETKGFVVFVLFKPHLQNGERTINNIQTFRNYLHYHIKCSKAHLHTCMRARVDSLLQILNRARPTDAGAKEKKTAAGKTFVRK